MEQDVTAVTLLSEIFISKYFPLLCLLRPSVPRSGQTRCSPVIRREAETRAR